MHVPTTGDAKPRNVKPFHRLLRARRTKARVYVHVGPHKTGTTSVQGLFLRMKDVISYPEVGDTGPGHALLFHKSLTKGCEGLLADVVESEWSQSSGRPILLSAEAFMGYARMERQGNPLALLAARFPSELIMAFRDPEERIVSSWQQKCWVGLSSKVPDETAFWEETLQSHNYQGDVIDRLLALGPWKRLHAVFVDKRDPGFLIDSFSRILGVMLPTPDEKQMLNAGRPYVLSRLAFERFAADPAVDPSETRRRCLEEYRDMLARDPAVAEIPYPAVPDWVRDRVRESHLRQMASLRELERGGVLVCHRPDRW